MKKRIKETSVDNIIPDDKNMNAGSTEGAELVNKSFRKFGAGRSILIDKNNRTIAGNKSFEAFKETGGTKVLIVDVPRDTLVAVRREDLDLDTAEGREAAMADNQTAAINYVPDEEVIQMVAEEYNIDTAAWGMPIEEDAYRGKPKEEELRPYRRTHVLLSFSPELLLKIQPHLDAIKKIEGVEYEQASN